MVPGSLTEQFTTPNKLKFRLRLMPCKQNSYVSAYVYMSRRCHPCLSHRVNIFVLQSAVKEKIALAGGGKTGHASDRRNALHAELDSVRGQQSGNKATRTKIRDQLQTLQDGIQKKVHSNNSEHIPFSPLPVVRSRTSKQPNPKYRTNQLPKSMTVSSKSLADWFHGCQTDVDVALRQLEKQIESGNLKLADEKRALQEISQCTRSRRTIEGFQAEQDSIDSDRAKADELRKQLDDPEAKAASERYDQIRAELDEIKKEGDEAYANRNKLFDERNALQRELDDLFNKKRSSAQRFRDANDHHWNKVYEERARRAERMRAQRQADEEAKRKQQIERLREEADAPAFQVQIEDCQTLIDYFSGKTGTATLSSAKTEVAKAELEGVPKLDLRKVDEEVGNGMVVRAKKGEEESYFVGGKGKRSKKNNGTKSGPISVTRSSSSGTESGFNAPLHTLRALLSLSIPPPTSNADVPRLIENLRTKKSWFEANQDRVTAENKAKVEAEIRRLGGKPEGQPDLVPSGDALPPNGGGEEPPEPAPTPAAAPVPSLAVSSAAVAEELEVVREEGE